MPTRHTSTHGPNRLRTALAATTLLLGLAGCGAGGGPGTQRSSDVTDPSYVDEPFTHHQELIEQGGRLIVTDGCAACHLQAQGRKSAPSFSSFAGHHLTLQDGHRVLVDEHFLKEGLLHPDDVQIKGYAPALMLVALEHLHLNRHRHDVAALAAFIEQIGAEPEE